MEAVDVNINKCKEVSHIFKELTNRIPIDSFTDERFYPPKGTDTELVTRYFMFMVAIDHRTSRYRPFEAIVDGQLYHGADLLYKLGMKKFTRDPEFFSPERMAKITPAEVASWLSVKGIDGEVITVWDYEARAKLLNDLGSKILDGYGGSCYRVILLSGNYLKRDGRGFIDRLKAFKAYSDPVEKKAYLLVKFLNRRGILTFTDVDNAEVPVDNHVSRIALRLGLIELSDNYFNKILMREPFTEYEDIMIRSKIRDAFKVISYFAGVSPLILDDLLWMFGRDCCTRGRPACIAPSNSGCVKLGMWRDGCPFSNQCILLSKGVLIDEHLFEDTYYY